MFVWVCACSDIKIIKNAGLFSSVFTYYNAVEQEHIESQTTYNVAHWFMNFAERYYNCLATDEKKIELNW